jgi:hypothetical protein
MFSSTMLPPVSRFANSNTDITGEAHHLKTGENDETDPLHGASPDDVLKRGLYDI